MAGFKKFIPDKVKGIKDYGGTAKIIVSKNIGSQLCSGIFTLKPGEALVRDIHENDEVFYAIKGKLTVATEDGKKTEVLKGEILLIPRGEVHYSKNNSKTDTDVFWCFIEPL